jgi:hypothetical protein
LPKYLTQDLQAAATALQASDPKLAGYLTKDAANPSGKYVKQDLTKAASELTALGGSTNTKLAGYCTNDAAQIP